MEKALFSEADKPHVLVVDDDDRIRSLLSRFLRDNGFVVATAKNGNDALDVLKCAYFDVLVVDVMMPEKDGLELTRDLRATSDLPVLLLTALGEVDDRIAGLEVGADDYLSKPFEPKELVLRLKAILRRKGGSGLWKAAIPSLKLPILGATSGLTSHLCILKLPDYSNLN